MSEVPSGRASLHSDRLSDAYHVGWENVCTWCIEKNIPGTLKTNDYTFKVNFPLNI